MNGTNFVRFAIPNEADSGSHCLHVDSIERIAAAFGATVHHRAMDEV